MKVLKFYFSVFIIKCSRIVLNDEIIILIIIVEISVSISAVGLIGIIPNMRPHTSYMCSVQTCDTWKDNVKLNYLESQLFSSLDKIIFGQFNEFTEFDLNKGNKTYLKVYIKIHIFFLFSSY